MKLKEHVRAAVDAAGRESDASRCRPAFSTFDLARGSAMSGTAAADVASRSIAEDGCRGGEQPGHSWNSPRATTTALPPTSTRSICSGVPHAVA